MKTGAIIYVAGDEPRSGFDMNADELLRKSGIIADRWEIITRNTGHFDVHDAWWHLISGGMQRVLCMMARVDDKGELQSTGRLMRLCG